MNKTNFERFDDFFTRYDTISEGVEILSTFLNCAKITIYTWRNKKAIPNKKFALIEKEFKI